MPRSRSIAHGRGRAVVHASAVQFDSVGRQLGAHYFGDGRTAFRVWAPSAESVSLELYEPTSISVQLQPSQSGHWSIVLENVEPEALYKFRLGEDRVFPDPASQFQPEGVHGPSMVVSSDFEWTDLAWHGRDVEEYVLYELHVAAFTSAGTFEAAIEHLPCLKSLGVTAVEVMPVAQFPGSRNWGYDGVYPFAVQNSYGGPTGFKRFIDAAHSIGLAVVLDVVYNHLGPEGNYLGQFGPYFTDRYHTPWGSAIDFDGPESEGVREYFLQNALYWVRDFHIDALRLDAVHAIFDGSSTHILSEIALVLHDFAQDQQRTVAVIAESDLNEARLVHSGELGGYGLDAQWSDDFHHAVHTVLTGERTGYYEDFGRIEDVAKALASGFVYSGQYSSHRGKCHGTDCTDVPGRAFVVCVQNHDQIGNRMLGERLSHIVDFDQLKSAAGLLLLSPYVPLLFMGQEYAETAPFLYFVSHSDPGLVAAVREGRQREFQSSSWKGEVPDAQEESTFLRSKLNQGLRTTGKHAVLARWYSELLHMRASHPALKTLNRRATAVELVGDGHTVVMRRWNSDIELLAAFHLGKTPCTVDVEVRQQRWVKLLDGADAAWLGGGSAAPDTISAERGCIRLALQPFQCLVIETGGAIHSLEQAS